MSDGIAMEGSRAGAVRQNMNAEYSYYDLSTLNYYKLINNFITGFAEPHVLNFLR